MAYKNLQIMAGGLGAVVRSLTKLSEEGHTEREERTHRKHFQKKCLSQTAHKTDAFFSPQILQ